MQTITTLQIRDAFVTKILGIVPTFEPLRSVRWSFVPGARKNGRAQLPAATRNFDLIFGAGAPTYAWFGTGEAYSCRLAVATSYAGVDADLLEHLVTADAVDLRRHLNQLRDPSLPGLVDVAPLGISNEQVDDYANIYLEHVFQVHYHQNTDYE